MTLSLPALVLRGLVAVAGALPFGLALAHLSRQTAYVFATLCHQRPERTLWLLGEPMVVCSRCAGLYAGVLVGAVFGLPAVSLPRVRFLLGGAVLLMVAEVAIQDLGFHAPFHPTRLATGFLAGAIASAWMSARLPVWGSVTSALRDETSR